MSNLLSMIAENIVIVIGFALYGVLVYYMVSKALRKYSKKKPASGRTSAGNGSGSTASSSEKGAFDGLFSQKKDETKEQTGSRKDFARNIPTANSHIHKDCQGQ